MAVSLKKGGNISLSGEVPGLKSVFVGLGWSARETKGEAFDLDASAFILSESGRVRGDEDFIFYNQLTSPDGSIEHTGDELEGGSGGDDETIKVSLETVPAWVQKISFTVSIHEAAERKQNFGMVSDAYIRIVNQLDDREIVKFDLSEDMSTETAMIFGEIYRYKGEWKFKAVGQGFEGGLKALAKHFGVEVE
ncbi:MAG: TerD family protein [Deltaproteobacteria bacterium]|jgi:tellurium resistance protein TerD|nr:TerD family protein [Deltaproteobacteria bacterium]